MEAILASHEAEVEFTQQRFNELNAAVINADAVANIDREVFSTERDQLALNVQELGERNHKSLEELEASLIDQLTSNRSISRAEGEALRESIQQAEDKLDRHQDIHVVTKAAIAELGKKIGKLEEGWTVFQQETGRKCNEQTNQLQAVDNELAGNREQLTAKLEGLQQSLSYSGGELASHKLTNLEFGQQVRALQKELTQMKENLTLQMEQVNTRLTLAHAQEERLENHFHVLQDSTEETHCKQVTSLSAIRSEVVSMRQIIDDIAKGVRSRGAAEHSKQSGKLHELDSLLASQQCTESKIRVLEDALRGLEDIVSRRYQDHMEQIIQLNEEQGKLSGHLTERWGSLDVANVSLKNDFKRNIDEMRTELEQLIKIDNVGNKQRFDDLESTRHRVKTHLTQQIREVQMELSATKVDLEEKLTGQVAAVNSSLVRLGHDEVAVAVQTVRSFRARIVELERRVTEMDNVIEEYPREWKNNLLFHGLELKEGESFFSLASAVSKIIR
jgi:hypothetical protein